MSITSLVQTVDITYKRISTSVHATLSERWVLIEIAVTQCGWRILGTASSKYRAIWRVLSLSTLIAVEPPSGKRSSENPGPMYSLYTLSAHTKHMCVSVYNVRLWIARENAKENQLDGEKVARRQSQAYRCQSVNRKSLTAPRPSRILHFLPPQTRHPPFPPPRRFAIRHSACTAFHVFFNAVPSFHRRGVNPSDGGEETELYCKSIYCGHSDGVSSFWGTDYKFKCKPT